MKKTDAENFKDAFKRFYRRVAKLNLYTQNYRSPDTLHIASELKDLSSQLNELIQTPEPRGGNYV